MSRLSSLPGLEDLILLGLYASPETYDIVIRLFILNCIELKSLLDNLSARVIYMHKFWSNINMINFESREYGKPSAQ